jgi:hypothetical protein
MFGFEDGAFFGISDSAGLYLKESASLRATGHQDERGQYAPGQFR